MRPTKQGMIVTDNVHLGFTQAALTLQMSTLNLLVEKGILNWSEVKEMMDKVTLAQEEDGISDAVAAHAHGILMRMLRMVEQKLEPSSGG